MKSEQIKSKERVKKHAEVFTAEREVKAMCNLIPSKIWENIESTFLEPACGTGNFLVEIYARKLERCQNEDDGLKALNSIFGIDILADNVCESRQRLVDMFLSKFPKANGYEEFFAWAIVSNNIVCDDALNPKTEIVKSWGLTADERYVKTLEKIKQGSRKNDSKTNNGFC